MDFIKYSLGLDVSKDDVQACLVSIDLMQNVKICASRKFKNTVAGLETMVKWIEKNHRQKSVPLTICLEVTGVYHELFLYGLESADYFVSLIVPTYARRFMQSLGMHSKNDKIDAEGLARLGAERQLTRWQPGSIFYSSLRNLTRARQNFSEDKNIATNRLHAHLKLQRQSELVIKQMKSVIEAFEVKIKELEKAIAKLVKSNSEVLEKVDRVCEIFGVGLITVATLIAETFGFEAFENTRQLISYSGFDVIENQSGYHRGKTRISKRGNARIRRALYMPSLQAKKKASFAAIYERTLSRHHIKMKSLVAVQRKMLVTIFALWKSGEVYDPNYQSNKEEEKSTPALAGVQ